MDNLDLTKKGEAYAAANYSQPEELPPPLLVDCQSRRSIADSIERLIDMLDAMSPDPDLEDGADDEPSLGSNALGSYQAGTTDDREGDFADFEDSGDEHDASASTNWAKGGHWCEDVEEENEHGGDILDEPHDDQGEAEPSLGWGNVTGQTGVGVEGWGNADADTGFDNGLGFTGEGHEIGREMVRRLMRPEPSLKVITIVGPFPRFGFGR
ncbi:hypothetical protein NKI94_19175 [Mesorhizobium australicum]|uniref:hypothetical protein n=1 Tax=Mesorhizobium australicum TaxID=536018 RepID=UPI0033387247